MNVDYAPPAHQALSTHQAAGSLYHPFSRYVWRVFYMPALSTDRAVKQIGEQPRLPEGFILLCISGQRRG